MDAVTKYASEVVYGNLRTLCGISEYQSCKRHLNDIESSKKKNYPYVFDETRAERIFKSFSLIKRIDVEGEYIELEPWQKFDLGCIFGWVNKKTGLRRFSTAYIRVARGHAKTTEAAGVGAIFMAGDSYYPPGHPEEIKYIPEPYVNIVAVDKIQGRMAHSDLEAMIKNTPEFSKRIIAKKTYIQHRTRGGGVVLFSRDKNNKDGGRPSLIITEEWHAHKTSKVHDIAVSGKGKKPQCLELIITTAGEDAENKPCYVDDLYYKRILRGEVKQDETFIMIREIDDDDDPHDKTCWQKANPFFRGKSEYGRNLYSEVVLQYNDAFGSGNPDKIREFLIKRMNRWQAESVNKYFTGCMAKFKKCLVPREELQALIAGSKGHYGFDLGKTIDLSGSAYATWLKDGRLAFSVHGFLPEERATEHEHSDRVPYKDWARDGWVTLTPGSVTDNVYVEQWIYEHESDLGWGCYEINYDGHNATDLANRLRANYNSEEKVVEIPQNQKALNQGTKRFRELVLQGKVVTENNPLCIWCLNNAIEEKNQYGDIKLSKRHKDDSQRIDPVAALMNCLARMVVLPVPKKTLDEIIKERGYAIK